MAYESGKWLNRYYARQIGKNKQKRQQNNKFILYLDYNDSNKYWKQKDFPSLKRFTKQQTNRRVRRKYKNIHFNLDNDNEMKQPCLKFNSYKKVFNYQRMLA